MDVKGILSIVPSASFSSDRRSEFRRKTSATLTFQVLASDVYNGRCEEIMIEIYQCVTMLHFMDIIRFWICDRMRVR